jgi:hypothetical protein
MNAKDPSVSPDLTRAIADFAFGSQTFTHGSRPLAWLSPDEMDIDLADEKQRRFGDYELLERIGQGGMGVVYRARQHGLERDVAVKLLAAGPWASDEFVARFRREARNAARMQHPNIVEIYEFGHRDGLNFFSMRLVEGPSLAQRLAANGPMPERDAAKCARLLAEAMDYAHRLDVLHLDLKPANVLISHSGEPLIADFGLARRVDAGIGGGNEEISGTPSYMAPEQALQQSHPLTASTDIYGLGAILYEMLTGRPPFRGADAQSTLEAVLHESPPNPRSLRPGLSRDLEAICLRCLEKQPNDRYPSSRELADDLQRFIEGHPVAAHPLNWRQRLGRWARREPQLALAIAAAFLALALGGATTAVAWRKARQMQADAEYLGMATILPSARNTEIYALSKAIHDRMSESARRERARELARSSDPHDWIAAGLVGHTLSEPDNIRIGDEAIRRAVEALPDDRLALIAAIRVCRGQIRYSEVNSQFNQTKACPVPDAPQSLLKLEPNNLFAWLSVIVPPGMSQNEAGQFIWKYRHDPAENARIRALLAKAAQATTWDSGTNEIYAAKASAYGVNYFPMERAYFDRDQNETESADSMKDDLWKTWREAWSPRGGGTWTLETICNPLVSEVGDALRADCSRIFQVLARSKGDFRAIEGGWVGLLRLNKGTAIEAEIVARWKQYLWLREQRLWAREREPIAASRGYMRDIGRFGQWEADLRQADRVGVPRQPPPGWKPALYDSMMPFGF